MPNRPPDIGIRAIRVLSKAFLGVASLVLVVALIVPFGLRLAGYRVNRSSSEVAREAAESGDPALCDSLLTYLEFLGVSTSERRAMCVREYAAAEKDPAACEPLMPSPYGLGCVGGALDAEFLCSTDAYRVSWMDGVTGSEMGLRDCVEGASGRSELGDACCTVARVLYLRDENDCSPLRADPRLHDQCLYGLAWKQRDEKYCDPIANDNARAACRVRAKGVRLAPTICRDCTKPVDSVDELPED